MWSLYDIPRSLRKHLISTALILLSVSAVRVQDSHAYRKTDMTNEGISLILELMVMFLLLHIGLSLVSVVVVWAILERISGFDPSSVMIDPKYYLDVEGLDDFDRL